MLSRFTGWFPLRTIRRQSLGQHRFARSRGHRNRPVDGVHQIGRGLNCCQSSHRECAEVGFTEATWRNCFDAEVDASDASWGRCFVSTVKIVPLLLPIDFTLTFGDVLVRVKSTYQLEMHIDTDEGNAAELDRQDVGRLEAGDLLQRVGGASRLTKTDRRRALTSGPATSAFAFSHLVIRVQGRC